MAIILNVGIVLQFTLVQKLQLISNKSDLVAHCLITCDHCLLNTCEVLEPSQQHTMNRKSWKQN